jgi:hypothetical protein
MAKKHETSMRELKRQTMQMQDQQLWMTRLRNMLRTYGVDADRIPQTTSAIDFAAIFGVTGNGSLTRQDVERAAIAWAVNTCPPYWRLSMEGVTMPDTWDKKKHGPVLRVVAEKDHPQQQEITDAAGIGVKRTVQSVLDDLERWGFVARPEGDRSGYVVTDQGRKAQRFST